ncbi:ATP-binding protein [Saccharopolyspora sp. CA-218241]|uniref:ATP-binding protein n=1 Tax=Saccharopolyspora sp. CA-218241 TaxID=3240027 RepID=UPI003D980CF9
MPGRFPPMRRALAGWAGQAGLNAEQVERLVLVSYEALANVAAHAYPDSTGTLDLQARFRPGASAVEVWVTDHGVCPDTGLDYPSTAITPWSTGSPTPPAGRLAATRSPAAPTWPPKSSAAQLHPFVVGTVRYRPDEAMIRRVRGVQSGAAADTGGGDEGPRHGRWGRVWVARTRPQRPHPPPYGLGTEPAWCPGPV